MNSTPESPQKRPSMTDDITVRDIILWNRIGRISVLLAKRLNIEPERAFDIFYESDTCEHLHDETSGLFNDIRKYVASGNFLGNTGSLS